jgi:hypothetical protein
VVGKGGCVSFAGGRESSEPREVIENLDDKRFAFFTG